MGVTLITAPAGGGKSTVLRRRVVERSRALDGRVLVCVPTPLLARRWKRDLNEDGGALGVQVLTFDELVNLCLQQVGAPVVELPEPARFRLLRRVATATPLTYFQPLQSRVGFIQSLQQLFEELKGARIQPEEFLAAVTAAGGETRLQELGRLYAAYQEQLRANGWVDRSGAIWVATEQLQIQTHVGSDWALLAVDGFDSFTPSQLALLSLLARRVDETVVALTSAPRSDGNAYRRFRETIATTSQHLDAPPTPLPVTPPAQAATAPALRTLAENLAHGDPLPAPVDAAPVTLIAAPDQAAEVRAALRWLKQRIVQEEIPAGETALIARDIAPYQSAIRLTAREMGLPLHLATPVPLRRSPVIASLLDLLRLYLQDEAGELTLPRRQLVATWRSPYFNWSAGPDPIGIAPAAADGLDLIARYLQVPGGMTAWRETLQRLATYSPLDDDDSDTPWPSQVPSGPAAAALLATWERFLTDTAPPPQPATPATFIRWLERLLGPDETDKPLPAGSLGVVVQARAGEPALAAEDVTVLRRLKDVLRGLVWSDWLSGGAPTWSYNQFFEELLGAIEAAEYTPPVPTGGAIIVVDAQRARGLRFRVTAILGLGEGIFPAAVREDPFLRDDDRRLLQRQHLPLEPSTLSNERTFFYHAVSRAAEQLLLTRPRLAENGAEWVASPFWERIGSLLDLTPLLLSSEDRPVPAAAASPAELLLSAATYPDARAAREWLAQEAAPLLAGHDHAAQIMRLRSGRRASPFDGDLTDQAPRLAPLVGETRHWSASRIEAYLTCPHFFFTGRLLRLEPRPEPDEPLSVRHTGNIYHHIFEALYQAHPDIEHADEDTIAAAVAAVADPILDAAPAQEGFRATAWWGQTRREIVANVVASVHALADLAADFTPFRSEARFGGRTALRLTDAGEQILLTGFIDRIDRNEAGQVRIVDYKSGSPASYTDRDLQRGKRIQLALYALAAQESLGLGQVVDGFYWHFHQAAPSRLRLSEFGDEGIEEAIDIAVDHAWQAVRGARAGAFQPRPPDDGCPSYCPAAAYCWQYSPGWW